ncbi:MAG: CBS domain-containing protein [Thaumarchaeota archaeon]|nr:CBS domain-containing protein [Nitrososphaerota archaeon]
MARVKDIARKGAVTVDINAKAADIAKTMIENDVAAVLVTHEEKVVGIITERDLKGLGEKSSCLFKQ